MLGIATFKRLDDGYYEQQLVAEQLRNLSGHFYDGNDTDANTRYRAGNRSWKK